MQALRKVVEVDIPQLAVVDVQQSKEAATGVEVLHEVLDGALAALIVGYIQGLALGECKDGPYDELQTTVREAVVG